MPAPLHIACPLDLESFMTAGFVDGLSSLELGASARLIRAAWREEPPCTLPGEDIALAVVARCTDDEWARIKPRVFAALAATGGTSGDRVLLGHARRVHDDLAARAAAETEQRRAAGRASAAARRGDPPPPTDRPPGNGRSTGVERVLNERSTGVPLRSAPLLSLVPGSSALSLNRSESRAQSERSERSEPAREVIAAINSDVQGLLEQKTAAWRARQSRVILELAIDAWRKAGLTTCPTSKALSLAALPAATPARVDYLVTHANDLISAQKARNAAGKKKPEDPHEPPVNPIGVVIGGLGASERSRKRGPWEVPLAVAKRWQEAEADAIRAIEVQASINSRLASLTNPASTDQAGVRPGGGRA